MLEQRLRAAGAEVSELPGGERTNLWRRSRPCGRPRPGALGPHGRRVGRGSELDVRSVRPDRTRLAAAGRGTADMKGFLSAAVVAFEDAGGGGLSRPLHLSLSTDEEIGCVGIAQLAPWIAGLDPLPAGCVVGEPTGMRAVTATRARWRGRVTVTGTAVHSALAPLGVNAVEEAARADRTAAPAGRPADRRRAARRPLPGADRDVHDRADPRRHGAERRARHLRLRVRGAASARGRTRRRCSRGSSTSRSPATRASTSRRTPEIVRLARSAGAGRAAPSASAPRPACSPAWVSRPSSAGRATSPTRIGPMSRWSWSSWSAARRSWAGWSTRCGGQLWRTWISPERIISRTVWPEIRLIAALSNGPSWERASVPCTPEHLGTAPCAGAGDGR